MTYPMVGGFLLYALAAHAAGSRRVAIGSGITAVILPIGYAATSWPGYFALHADLPPALNWFASAALLGLRAAMAVGATALGQRWHDVVEAAPSDRRPIDTLTAPTRH